MGTGGNGLGASQPAVIPPVTPSVEKSAEYLRRFADRDAREPKRGKIDSGGSLPTPSTRPRVMRPGQEGGSSSSDAPPVDIPRERPSGDPTTGDARKVRQRLDALDAENTSLARYFTGEPAERADRWNDTWD